MSAKTQMIRLVLTATASAAFALAAPAASHAEGWWPGGGDKSETAPATPAPVTPAADEEAMVDSPLFKVSWPKIQMPKLSWKPGFGSDQAAPPTAPKQNPVSRALDKVADGSRRASDSVRNAWGSAVSKLPFGGGDTTTQTAKQEGGFWSRLLAPAEEPREPQTVQEFLAQERVGTTR